MTWSPTGRAPDSHGDAPGGATPRPHVRTRMRRGRTAEGRGPTAGSESLVRMSAFLMLSLSAFTLWTGTGRATNRVEAVASTPSVEPATAPAQLGEWSGQAIEIDARTFEILETQAVSSLEYRRDGEEPPVWFALVAGFGQRAAFHPPELCYVGSHFEVLERQAITVEVNGARRRLMRLVVGQDGGRVEAWYWFTAGRRVTSSYYQQQFWLVFDTMRGREASGTLVRISTPIDDAAGARERLLSFLQAFEEAST